MEKSKKSKKKLIGIIAGCAMAFVLTVVVSVAVTLAYFGDKSTGTGTLKMQGAVSLGDSVTISNSTTNPILPGATVEASASVAVDSTDSKNTPTDFVVAVKFSAVSTSEENSPLSDTAISNFKVGDKTYYLVQGEDLYNDTYYVVATAEETTKLAVIPGTAAEQTLTFDLTSKINTALTNESAASTITFTATVVAIQSFAIDAGNQTAPTIAGAQTNIAALFTVE